MKSLALPPQTLIIYFLLPLLRPGQIQGAPQRQHAPLPFRETGLYPDFLLFLSLRPQDVEGQAFRPVQQPLPHPGQFQGLVLLARRS